MPSARQRRARRVASTCGRLAATLRTTADPAGLFIFAFAATGFPLPPEEEERWAATSTARALPEATRADLRDAEVRAATARDACREPLRTVGLRAAEREVRAAAAAE